MTTEVYGFVGIGHMGGPMATRMINAGKRVVVFDTDEAAVAALTAAGAEKSESSSAVANLAETIFLSLPTPDIVKAVTLGGKDLLRERRSRW